MRQRHLLVFADISQNTELSFTIFTQQTITEVILNSFNAVYTG